MEIELQCQQKVIHLRSIFVKFQEIAYTEEAVKVSNVSGLGSLCTTFCALLIAFFRAIGLRDSLRVQILAVCVHCMH